MEQKGFFACIFGGVLLVESTTSETEGTSQGVSRRDFLKFTAGAAAVAASSATILGTLPSLATQTQTPSSLFQTGPASSIEEATIAQLQAQMIAGTLKSLSLVNMYLSRITAIDASGPFLNSILQTNPDATTIASQLDSRIILTLTTRCSQQQARSLSSGHLRRRIQPSQRTCGRQEQ
ncbi:twin-arginine translocation signal domain-containing protein [Candidatus Bathyarchaeota archaeon]|nr:MAG: twin-arginine translocation signal domain-containing protein [Candidatus Bathyarchaeota archaeon]